MTNDQGKVVKHGYPCDPVEVSGWKALPEVGDTIYAVESEVGVVPWGIERARQGGCQG